MLRRGFSKEIKTLIKDFSYASNVIELLWLHKYKNISYVLSINVMSGEGDEDMMYDVFILQHSNLCNLILSLAHKMSPFFSNEHIHSHPPWYSFWEVLCFGLQLSLPLTLPLAWFRFVLFSDISYMRLEPFQWMAWE